MVQGDCIGEALGDYGTLGGFICYYCRRIEIRLKKLTLDFYKGIEHESKSIYDS